MARAWRNHYFTRLEIHVSTVSALFITSSVVVQTEVASLVFGAGLEHYDEALAGVLGR